MEKVLIESKERGLLLQKPSKLGTGKTIPIAQRTDYIQTTENGLIDLKKQLKNLKNGNHLQTKMTKNYLSIKLSCL
ncbi:hypothetical protein [Neobacillus sp. LXY-1]|uniref:hypothetical protein n=1 Tax=Neobacillus sp. LXY-1 TaxID=3379133 RepID=UPI003EE1A05B